MTTGKTDKAESRAFRLSNRLLVEITVGPGGLTVEWEPSIPDQLSAKELRRYRHARHEMALRLSEIVGGAVVVVET